MPIKQNNHFVPSLILKHWVTLNQDNRKGVYVLDAEKNKKYFSESEGKKRFSFAIATDLYVPIIDGERRVELEDWFGGLEGVLDRTIRKLKSDKKGPLFDSNSEMTKFVLALLSFKHRSKYILEKNREYLEKNPSQIKLIGGEDQSNLKLSLLENIVNSTTYDLVKLSNFKMVVMKSKGDSLIIGDLPFIEDSIDGFNFLPLTNKIFIGIKSVIGKSYYEEGECDNKMVDSLNYAIASNSRYWMVADNIAQIEKYEEEFKNNLDSESIYIPIDFPMQGGRFK